MRRLIPTIACFCITAFLSAASLSDISLRDARTGKTHTVAEIGGKITIVNFWATWCPPCRVELPVLARIHAEYRKRGLALIPITLDAHPDKARKFLDKRRWKDLTTYSLIRPSSGELGVDSLPTTFILDESGHLLMTFSGYDSDMESIIRKLLHEQLDKH